MRNNLTELNNYLFEQIERINDDDLTEDELKLAIKKADSIANLAQTIITNTALQLKAVQVADNIGIDVHGESLQKMIEVG